MQEVQVTSPSAVAHQDTSNTVLPPAISLQPPSSPDLNGLLARSDTASDGGRSSTSVRDAFEDMKHEVMVNHLYQQQCSRLWVSDGSGEIEGVLLRESRGRYLACPQQLGNSHFAQACAELNFQVRCAPTVPNFR